MINSNPRSNVFHDSQQNKRSAVLMREAMPLMALRQGRESRSDVARAMGECDREARVLEPEPAEAGER